MSINSIVLIILSVFAAINVIVYVSLPRFRRAVAIVSRTFIGLLFIFSGFVKGVDPLGFMYRIEDYFAAYHTLWAMPLAIYLSVFLIAFEFTLGVLLLLNIKVKYVCWLVLMTMAGFTVITLYDALYSPVPDCGCFGDAITLTNFETFWKNIVIDSLLLLLLLYRNKFSKTFSIRAEVMVMVTVPVLFIGFELFNYRHLPVIDFMEWKTGKKMFLENPQPLKYYLTYKNKTTGEKKEYLSPDYPYNDSIWMSKWEFVSTRVEDPNPKITNLMISDSTGADITAHFIRNPDYQFLLIVNDMKTTNKEAFKKINTIYYYADSSGYSLIGITSGLKSDIAKFRDQMKTTFELYNADDVILKTMVRSNPGLILLKNGIVIKKWHYHDFPERKELSRILKK